MIIDVSPDVYKDTNIDNWISSNLILNSSKPIIIDLIKNPINDVNVLKLRQNVINMYDISYQLNYLKQFEFDIDWVLKLNNKNKNIENDYMEILFPNNWYNNIINLVNPSIELYHLYRIYSIPLFQLISPISILLGPYYYLKYILKFNINLNTYFIYIWKILKFYINNSSNIKSKIIKWISFLIYCFLYIYSLFQIIDSSYKIHKFRIDLLIKINNIKNFIKVSNTLLNKIDKNIWINLTNNSYYDNNFEINGDLLDIYNFWLNNNNYKYRLKRLINCINLLDITNLIKKLYINNNYCLVNFSNETKIYGMKNPLLKNNQTSNPCKLDKHLIITGPNAAGKTTYVKTIVLNIILAQTFGIAMAFKMTLKPFDIIHTFMRVNDEIGKLSYFETEIKYCKNILFKANKFKNKNILFVMDEPMHSTPPIEGQSTAYALCEYINLYNKNCKLIVTTHYHLLVDLATKYNNDFKNISMEAIEYNLYNFKFPYKLLNKSSKQCIALELLGREMFPTPLIKSAIKIKNTISKHI
jgi:hypothetical protein